MERHFILQRKKTQLSMKKDKKNVYQLSRKRLDKVFSKKTH